MPRGKKKQANANHLAFHAAVKQVALCQLEKGIDDQTHCSIAGGTIIACDSVLAAGVLVTEDLCIRPHTHKLLAALGRCESEVSLRVADNGKLVVKSGPFRAMIPCLDPSDHEWFPDPIAGECTGALVDSLEIASTPVRHQAERLLHASILIAPGFCAGANGAVLLQAWHGLDFPREFTVPKVFQVALSHVGKTPTHFGYSDRSFTVYFQDKSWLRTQCYSEAWPSSILSIFDVQTNPQALPKDFWKAAHTVADFSDTKDLHWNGCALGTQPISQDNDACYDLEADPGIRVAFDSEQLFLAEPFIETVDPQVLGKKGMLFWSDNVRGAVAYRS